MAHYLFENGSTWREMQCKQCIDNFPTYNLMMMMMMMVVVVVVVVATTTTLNIGLFLNRFDVTCILLFKNDGVCLLI